jgi:hypothetical protein
MLYRALPFTDETGMCGYRSKDEEQEVGNSGANTVYPCVVSLITSVYLAANSRCENTVI